MSVQRLRDQPTIEPGMLAWVTLGGRASSDWHRAVYPGDDGALCGRELGQETIWSLAEVPADVVQVAPPRDVRLLRHERLTNRVAARALCLRGVGLDETIA